MILVIVIIIAALFVLLEYGIYWMAFYNSDRRKHAYYQLPKSSQYDEKRNAMARVVSAAAEVPAEEVRIRSYDGLTLFARYYETKKGAPLQIQFHGWRGGSLRDMTGAFRIAREHGQNVLPKPQKTCFPEMEMKNSIFHPSGRWYRKS